MSITQGLFSDVLASAPGGGTADWSKTLPMAGAVDWTKVSPFQVINPITGYSYGATQPVQQSAKSTSTEEPVSEYQKWLAKQSTSMIDGGHSGSGREGFGGQTDYGAVIGDASASGKTWGELSPSQQAAYSAIADPYGFGPAIASAITNSSFGKAANAVGGWIDSALGRNASGDMGPSSNYGGSYGLGLGDLGITGSTGEPGSVGGLSLGQSGLGLSTGALGSGLSLDAGGLAPGLDSLGSTSTGIDTSSSVGDFSGDVGGRDSGGGGGGDSKIICTAMNEAYGFGSYRQAIWLKYSERMTKEHERGYHKLFLPLVKYAFNSGNGIGNRIIRKVLEHGTRHRTADLRAEMYGRKRDFLGRFYRAIFEPLCYAVGKL